MNNHFPVLNAFIEDTCVIMVIAYLLARGRMLGLLFPDQPRSRRNVLLGIVLGLIGLSEVIFPGARSPYVTHTLLITFATLLGGLQVGLIAAAVVTIGALFLQTYAGVVDTATTLGISALLADAVKHLFQERFSLLRGLAAGMLVQLGVVLLHQSPIGILHSQDTLSHALLTVPANGFGLLLLQLILNDARMRTESERHRLEAERAQAMVAEAQLMALRARIHPHFLFNTLTSIAALCSIAPNKAEDTIIRLSQLMRRVLKSGPSDPQCLREEIEQVRAYLEIEQHRLGSRLQVVWEVDPAAETVQVPDFSLQILVENAVNHGIAPKMEPGRIRIVVRKRPGHVLVAVQDDGVGMGRETLRRIQHPGDAREHGLQLLAQQLKLLHGTAGRLHVFSVPGAGALFCFAIPMHAGEKGQLVA